MNCTRNDELRDYAVDELVGGAREQMEAHIAACKDCANELQMLRVTTAALRTLPDQEIPQRIAFVSDKVFAPSPAARFFGAFWNSAARLGFASACLLAGSIMFAAMHRTAEIRTVVQTATPIVTTASYTTADLDAAVQKAVEKARADVRVEIQKESARNTQVALAAVERKYDEKQKAFMLSVKEDYEYTMKRLQSSTMMANYDASRTVMQ